MRNIKLGKKRGIFIKRLLFLSVLIMGIYYVSLYIKLDDNAIKLLENYYVETRPNYTQNVNIASLPVFEQRDTRPIIYIYNTHQTEKYEREKLQSYNIDYTVEHAGQLLAYYLEDKDIYSYVEKENVASLLKANNFQYYQSYIISGNLFEKRKAEMTTLKYFIDIHRDAISYDLSVCEHEGKKYAKLLIVIGLEHDNYNDNLEFANKIDGALKESNPCISRGIMKKEGKFVDGVYNQDLSPKAVLIEVGSVYNYFEEVNNSLSVLAESLEKVIREDI